MQITEFNDKKILIWGYGREGKSTERFLTTYTKPSSITIYEGTRDGFSEEEYDYIIKSPGIPYFTDSPRFTSQTEIFLHLFGDRVIGITGTKGKSTTSSMLYHALRELRGDVLLVGNIGLPCLDYYSEITANTIVVFELSCHQLSGVTHSPHVAVFLNLYEEHLDYYKTLDNYFRAKSHITTYQAENDFLFVGENVPKLTTKAKTETVTRDSVRHFPLSVLGEQNQYNAEVVTRVCEKVFGYKEKDISESLRSFEGLSHRLEKVGTFDGITYYDDSISTIPEAAIAALFAVPDVKTILLGGMDRGISYDILIEFMENHPEYEYILMYDSGERIYYKLPKRANYHHVKDLSEAVQTAKKVTPRGMSCVLSPAAASYGVFRNFEERGDIFREYVKKH